MKILIVVALYPPWNIGGAELGVRTLALGLTARGWDVHIVTLAPSDGGGEPAEALQEGVRVHRVPMANLYWPYRRDTAPPPAAKRAAWHLIDTWNPLMAARVGRLVDRIRPDAAITHTLQGFSTALWPALARRGVPVMHVLNDFALLCPRTVLFRDGRNCGHGSLRCRSCRWLTRPRWRQTVHLSRVVGVSRAVLQIHEAHGLFHATPREVIYNALAPGETPLPALPVCEPRHELRFGFLGRVDEPKGIETLLEAASLLCQQGKRFSLTIGGRAGSDYLTTLQQRWPLSNVEYQGFVQPQDFLATIDVLVYPSLSLEALGNAVFEAYAKGVPVIGSRQGGIPEMIEPGVTGFTFASGDAAMLAEHMAMLIDQPGLREAMARAALNKSHAFLAQRRIDEFEQAIRAIVTDRSS